MNWKRHRLPLILMLVIVAYSCASIGNPDGGPYDEEPPKFVGGIPSMRAVNNTRQKIELEFNEFIKLEKPSEKVIFSPPQMEQPELKVVGKKVVIELLDTLKDSTTYTIDFSDAIVDNNEGNPMGNFSYSFSTGSSIDTMEVAGTVLQASDLEPIKGIQVGLHKVLEDSAFTTSAFDRVSRTDSRGYFSIRGVAPGKYRIYALKDGNQNYLYDSKTEMIAFSDSIIIPSMMPATRQDTVWKDTLTIDTIKTVNYTRYLPDSLILRAFKEENDRQYLTRSQRDKENHFILTFSAKADTLPIIKGLNFDDKDAFVIETTPRNDSICYWIKDSLVYQMDTLAIQLDYLYTDISLTFKVLKYQVPTHLFHFILCCFFCCTWLASLIYLLNFPITGSLLVSFPMTGNLSSHTTPDPFLSIFPSRSHRPPHPGGRSLLPSWKLSLLGTHSTPFSHPTFLILNTLHLP